MIFLHIIPAYNYKILLRPRKLGFKHEVLLNFDKRVAELTSYGAETWQTKVNIGLMVRNFYQSDVLYSHFIVSFVLP